MIRTAIICAALASPALAEGRNDPFYKCTFSDGRAIVLAENGEAFEWREGSFTAPVVAEPRLNHSPVITFIGIWGEPERIDVFLGWNLDANGPDIEIGTAMLTRTVITDDGQIDVERQTGACEDYFG